MEIFSNPSNLFVADFMGYKNSWTAKIDTLEEKTEGLEARIRVQGVPLDISLPYREGDSRREGIVAAFRSGANVKTAVRPENICVGSRPGMNELRCVAYLVEYQGHTSQASASFGESDGNSANERIDLRSDQPIRQGEIVKAAIAPDKILLFPEVPAETPVDGGHCL
jgi:putative spermidine/putrescine transport system ATP-binding protein